MITDGGLLDRILSDFTGAISGSWGPDLSSYLLPLLMGLVVLQFGMIAVEATIARDVPLLLIHVLLGIVRVGVVIAIFNNATVWGNDITSTLQTVGQEISGFTPATGPSEVFNNDGSPLIEALFQAKASGSWYNEVIQSVEFFIAGAAVLIAWVFAVLLYLGALIEVSLLVYAGPLIISVTPLSWTFDLLIAWGRELLSIGFRIALILMTLGLGTNLATGWVTAMDPASFTTNIWNVLVIVVESVIFAFILWKVPNRLCNLTPGGAILGFGEAVGNMASAAVGNSLRSASGGGSGGGAGSGGGNSLSDGWASQGMHALGREMKALAQKVQSKLVS